MSEFRNFLALSYDELEEINLKAKADRLNRVDAGKIQEERLKFLTDQKHIKAVTVMFSDLEGRIHLLDYDKKFLVKSYDNLTFDGSSIRLPVNFIKDGYKGYLEDRRPNSEADPYQIVSRILKTIDSVPAK